MNRFSLIALTLLLTITGCAGPALKVTRLAPPAIDLQDKKKIAIAKVNGPWEAQNIFSSNFNKDVASRGHYEIIDTNLESGEARNSLPFDLKVLPNGQVELKSGSGSSVPDAEVLVKVNVDSYRINEQHGSEKVSEQVAYTKPDGTTGYNTQYKYRPYIKQTGSASFTANLIDSKTRKLFGSKSYVKNYNETIYTDVSSVEDRNVVLENLMTEAVGNFVADLYPATVTDKFYFKKESEAVKPGVELAKKGNMARAGEEWKSVLISNPQNEEALYNLGVVYFFQKEYGQAKKYFESAYQIKPDQDFIVAMDKVDQVEKNQGRMKYWQP